MSRLSVFYPAFEQLMHDLCVCQEVQQKQKQSEQEKQESMREAVSAATETLPLRYKLNGNPD